MNYPIRIALIAALGGFLFGFETAVISGAEKTIQQLWSLSDFWQGFTVASSLIGTVIGSLIAGVPAKKYGRKKVLAAIAILYLISAIGCASVPVWLLFVLFRFTGGIAVGASSVVGPMYISEISPARLRGRLAGSFQLNIVAGIFIAYLVNFLFIKWLDQDAWRWMLGVMVIPAALFWLLLRSIPESPRWLILNGRDAEAIPIMQRLGESNVNKSIEDIRQSVVEHRESLFQSRYAKPIFYAVLLAIFNQLSGINAIIYYAPRIFEIAGFDKAQAYLQPVYIVACNLFFTLLAMPFIDRFGRKTLLIIGSVGMIVFLALTAQAVNVHQAQNGAVHTANYSMLIYLIGFIAFFAFSQGAVIWVFISEIFPNTVRSQGGSLGSFTHWIMAMAISWVYPSIAAITSKDGTPVGVAYSFYFFAAMMLLHLVFVWRVMPETKGKSLEQIQKELGIH
ncbi:MAG: sugar porter family MFS transporter [Bacteroidetes bacterium]|nr:sugar porter family MFS transporter [Bacteroidota bacterium]